MELLIIILLLLILLQVTYTTYNVARKSRSSKLGDILLDTSVLIDGRIVAIARSGLMSGTMIVPRSVVRELQFMADKADHDKRERARFGLDVIEKLQQLDQVSLTVIDDGTTSEHGVDEQLIVLARRSGAKLCTIDYNLNKAARVQSVEVININELAHALRIMHLPGESIDIELVQPGQDRKQAVGYLDDGTMVVVEDGRAQVGSSVKVELTRVLQTAAGRMMFAKKVAQAGSQQQPTQPRQVVTEPRRQTTPRVKKERPEVVVPAPQSRTSRNVSTRNDTHSPRPAKPRRGSKRTNEDKLVDLANK